MEHEPTVCAVGFLSLADESRLVFGSFTAINAAGGAGFGDDDFGEMGKSGF